MAILPVTELAKLRNALPFWLSLGVVPVAMIAATFGGWSIALLPAYSWGLFTLLDVLTGRNEDNADLNTPEAELIWYRLITVLWFPIQFVLIFGTKVELACQGGCVTAGYIFCLSGETNNRKLIAD